MIVLSSNLYIQNRPQLNDANMMKNKQPFAAEDGDSSKQHPPLPPREDKEQEKQVNYTQYISNIQYTNINVIIQSVA